MKSKIIWGIVMCFMLSFVGAQAEDIRIYRQIKDVSLGENGTVHQSQKKGDLFECAYVIHWRQNTITRIKVRRLDETTEQPDGTEYIILQRRHLFGSEAGNGGEVLVAIQKDGNELLELGRRFAFTARISPFSQILTGVYQRVLLKNPSQHLPRHYFF